MGVMGVLAALCLMTSAACGAADGDAPRPAITPRTLATDPAVIADVAAREGLDTDAAAARAQALAALAERYLTRGASQALPGGDDPIRIDPSEPLRGVSEPREAHLLRAARARVWLSDVFEPSHGPGDIPKAVVERADATTMPSHGKVHIVCNLVIGPTADDSEPSGAGEQPGPLLAKDDPAWRARVQRKADALAERLRTLVPDPGAEPDCEFFDRLIRLGIDVDPAPDVGLRVESGGFDSCREELWDPGWVDATCPIASPAWVGPFWTRFGAHVVAVIRIVEADEYEPSARESKVRDKILLPWRNSALGEQLARMRREVGVRVLTPAASDGP